MESSWMPFAIAVGLPYTVSTIEGFTMKDSLKNWYPKMKKAPWNPPNWVFGPVWTMLYGMMGYASYLVWREGEISPSAEVDAKVHTALVAYGVQLLLNWLWTPLFFNWHRLGLSTIEIIMLWGAVAYTITSFYAVNQFAAYLLIPYIMWGTFATTLTIYIWLHNDSNGEKKRA